MMFTYTEQVEKEGVGITLVEKRLEVELVKQALNAYCMNPDILFVSSIDLKNVKWYLSKIFSFDIQIEPGKTPNSFSCLMQDGTEKIVLEIAIESTSVS